MASALPNSRQQHEMSEAADFVGPSENARNAATPIVPNILRPTIRHGAKFGTEFGAKCQIVSLKEAKICWCTIGSSGGDSGAEISIFLAESICADSSERGVTGV
jgi:hypothetical protein